MTSAGGPERRARLAAVGGVRPRPPRAVATSTSAACTRPTPRWRCATPATSTPAAARACRIWVVPAAAITASSPDEKDAFFDPAADKVYRHPTFYDDPRRGASTCDRDRSTAHGVATTPLRPRATTRWCSPSGSASGSPAPRSSRRTSRSANIALDLLGQARIAADLRRRARGRGPHRGRPRLPARRARVPQRAAGRAARTATSRSRSRGSSCFSTYQLALYDARCATSTDATLAGDRRQGGQGGRLPPRPRRAVGAAPRRRHRRVATRRMQAALDDDVALRRRAVRRRAIDRGSLAAGVAVDPAALRAGVARRTSRPCSREATLERARPSPRGPAAAGAACTPSASGTCSPRCRTCTARTRGRPGDRRPTSSRARATVAGARRPTPRSRC